MSNLLNKNPKKKLLDRGPNISPTSQFKLESVEQTEPVVTEPAQSSEIKKAASSERKATSVRVRKSTRNKLNALVSLNKAETIDDLLDIMIEEYMSANLLKDEKKQFELILELYKSKG